MAERVDDLQYKGLRLIQDTDGFLFWRRRGSAGAYGKKIRRHKIR